MTQKPCACFGYVILQNTYPKNNVYEVQTSSASDTLLFLVKGHMVFRNKETKQMIEEHFPGAYGSDWADRLSEAVAVEESVLFCLSSQINRGYMPETIPVVLQENEADIFDAGTRLFLCEGTVEINGIEFTGPCQIGFKGQQTLKPKTNIYGLIVK